MRSAHPDMPLAAIADKMAVFGCTGVIACISIVDSIFFAIVLIFNGS